MERAERERLIAEVAVHLDRGTVPMAETTMENPISVYVDPAQTKRERDVLFAGQPRVIAFADQVRRPGDFVTDDLSGDPLLVVRGEDGELRAFHNVCRHRGTRLVCEAGGSKRRFACPFHGWTYDTAGDLRAVPDGEGFPDLDPDRRRLGELAAVERHGFVWLLPAGWSPDDLGASLGGLDGELAGFGLSGYVLERTEVIRQPFNWKLVMDGFLETYHFRFLHKNTIAPYIRSNFGPTEHHGRNLRMVALRRSYDEHVTPAPVYVDPLPHVAIVYLLFPNTVLAWQGDHFEVWTAHPENGGPDATVMRASLLAPTPTETEAHQRHWDRNWEILMSTVLNEDFEVSRQAQRGFATNVQTHVVFGRNEPALQAFHRNVAAMTAP